MSVEIENVGEPPATVRFEQPQGPFVVGEDQVDAVGKSTGYHEHNPGDETVSADWHDQTPSGQFDQPGPQTVRIEGFDHLHADDKSTDDQTDDKSDDTPAETPATTQTDSSSVMQTKVVSPPADGAADTTPGAETK